MKDYTVEHAWDNTYKVVCVETMQGSRLSAYESEPDVRVKSIEFQGSLADCNAWLQLNNKGYLNF